MDRSSRLAALLCLGSSLAPGGCGDGTGDASPIAAVAPAPADEATRAMPPMVGMSPPFRTPAVERFTLAGGTDVLLVERHTLPAVWWEIHFPGAGWANDPRGKEGLAEVCSWLMVHGGQRDTTLRLADSGSSITVRTHAESFSLNGFALRRNLGATVDLWGKVLAAPSTDARILPRLQATAADRLRQSKADPSVFAYQILYVASRGPDHPYARWPTDESYASLTGADCRQFLADHLDNRGARLYVAGDVTRRDVERLFGPRLAGGRAAEPAPPFPPPAPLPAKIVFADTPGTSQTFVALWGEGPDRAANPVPATTMMSIFGGEGSTSRLGASLREMMGSTYGVHGGLWSTKIDRRIWAITSVQTNRTKEAIEEILAQARLLREADVSDEELARARDGALASLPARFDTIVGTLGHFVSLVEGGRPLDELDAEATKLMAVDKAAVRAAAQTYLAPDGLRFVIVGDARLVMPRLRELVADGAALSGAAIQIVDGNGRAVVP